MTEAAVVARAQQLAAGLRHVRARITAAALASGRPAESVRLVVVTKTWPASDVRLLYAAGVRDVGENRDQEAREKAGACTDLDLCWHFVGQLQTNKAASVSQYADVVHSVDRSRLVDALGRGATAAGRSLAVLLQASLDGDTSRGGALLADLPGLADQVAATEGLELAGVMAVAPLGAEPDRAFETLARASRRLRDGHPSATWISAGMSGDLEAAVRHGATHVRVGSAILGGRPPLG